MNITTKELKAELWSDFESYFDHCLPITVFAMKTQYPELYSQRRELDVSVTATRGVDRDVIITPLGPLHELNGEQLNKAITMAEEKTKKLEAMIEDINSPDPFL